MRKEDFFEVLGEIDGHIVDEARTPMKKTNWRLWGAMAACLCLVFAGIGISRIPAAVPDSGAGLEPGGWYPDGIDPIIYSLATYPPSESITDVADATAKSISEAAAYGVDTLGGYLPAVLPDGYHFGQAGLYETTMKDQTKYYMLRVTYTTGQEVPQGIVQEDGGVMAPDPNTEGDSFVVFIMNHEPRTDSRIYEPADITEGMLAEIGDIAFHIRYGDVYVGIAPDACLAVEDIIALVNSIG